MNLALNNLQRLICHKTQTNKLFWHLTVCKQKLYLYYTELFEFELFDKTE